jgi:hypothetical protein
MKRALVLRKPKLPNNSADKACRPRARTRVWRSRFLAALRQTPSVKHACKAAGVSRDTAYKHRLADNEFAEAWLDALGASVDELETKAFQLAMAGDSTLITFLLRCHKPEVYGDKSRVDVGLLGGIVLLPAKEDKEP